MSRSAPLLDADDVALLTMLADGVSRDRLAVELGVNPRTIQRRIERIKRALDEPTTIQAVVAAVRRGLI